MSIRVIPVDTTGWKFIYQSTTKVYEYDRETNRRAADHSVDVDPETGEGTGLPLWKVECYMSDPLNRQSGEARVLVASATEPVAPFEEPIIFAGLKVKPWAMNGSSGQSWFADSFAVLADRPSAAKNGVKTPASVGASKQAE